MCRHATRQKFQENTARARILSHHLKFWSRVAGGGPNPGRTGPQKRRPRSVRSGCAQESLRDAGRVRGRPPNVGRCHRRHARVYRGTGRPEERHDRRRKLIQGYAPGPEAGVAVFGLEEPADCPRVVEQQRKVGAIFRG